MDLAEFEAPQSPKQAPSSPDYVPGPEHPPSPDYVPGLEYPEYVAPSDDEISVEDQPLLADASPTALSPGYVANFDPSEDLVEDTEEDPADYPTDGGDDDEKEKESSEDDDDDNEEDEGEHLAPADSFAATPLPPRRSPQTKVYFSQTCLCKTQKTVRLQPPMAASIEALIVKFASAPTPPSSPPSPLSPLSSPLPRTPSLHLHTSPTYANAPLGYRETMIQLRAASPPPIPSPPLLLPSADHRSDIPEMDMSFWKRLCLNTPSSRFEVGESSIVVAARQAGDTLPRRVDYEFIDTVDASIRASESRVMTTVEEVNERVTNLATTQRQDAHELYVRDEDAQDDQALLRAQISLLTRERRYFRSMTSSYEREAVIS
ncbi:hypothetical protein Tco_1195520 [Tanacetum coccineum]